MKFKQTLAIAVIGLLGVMGSANAAPITFKFDSATSGIHSVASPFAQTDMGTTVTVTGSDDLYNTRQGIGIGSDAFTSTGENISFTFTPNDVFLLSGIVFESARSLSGADFALYGDSVLFEHISFTNSFFSGGSYFTTLNFNNTSASMFTFAGLSDNGFRVKALTVDAPEPGMIALMSLGLLMAGVATRRRKS